jgi:addiction module RelE/StbE family toxin
MIVWSKPAEVSFLEHIEYLLARSPSGAANVVAAVIEGVEGIEEYPFKGRQGRWRGTRELVIARYPYIVAYRVRVDVIEILYVHHTRQQWPEGQE